MGSTSNVCGLCGPSTALPLQVDVNEYWSLDEALDALPALADAGVQYCEQPLPAARDPDGPELKRRCPDSHLRR